MNHPILAMKALRRELKRRKVARACLLYLIACWVALQVADIGFSLMGFDPAAGSPVLLAIAILGFPVTVFFSWFYQVSADGITRTPSFVERRILENQAPLDDRRREGSARGRPGKHETAIDWVLEIESGPLLGQRHAVDGDIVIGRAQECDLTIPVPHISRQHARFTRDDPRLRLQDLGSANGTKVNGARISGSVNLNHQDMVEILDVAIRVKESLAHAHSQDSTVMRNPTLQYKTETRKI